MTKDDKLDKYIASRDGIIIIVNLLNYTKDIFERIHTITKLISPNKPILFLFEKYFVGKITKDPCDTLKSITNDVNRKAFVVDYTATIEQKQLVQAHEELLPKQWFYKIMRNLKVHHYSEGETSKTINTENMIKQFENQTLGMKFWDHYGRLRIVHHSLMKYGYTNTIDQNGWLCKNWREYKTSIGHSNLWHYTIYKININMYLLMNYMKPIQTFISVNSIKNIIQMKYYLGHQAMHVMYGSHQIKIKFKK